MSVGGAEFWRPAEPLRAYVSGYHRYSITLPPGERLRDVFYPAWSNLRFTLRADTGWTVRIGRRPVEAVPARALFGPSSHAGYVDAPAGVMVGAGLTPLGWARLIGGDASEVADRIVPLGAHLPDANALHASLLAGHAPDALFDAHFLARLAKIPPEAPAIARVFEHLNDPAVRTIEALAAAAGLAPRPLARLTRRAFGFPPKLLLRRARFVRALTAAMAHDRGDRIATIRAAGYFDGSHFLRDCHLFLGRTLGEFAGMPRPLNRLSAAARTAVLGAPMQSLHAAADPPSDR